MDYKENQRKAAKPTKKVQGKEQREVKMYGYTTIRPRCDGTGTAYPKHHDITSAVIPHRNLTQNCCIQKTKWKTNTRPIVCTKFHVRHAICVTLVKQDEHLVPDLKNIKKKWKHLDVLLARQGSVRQTSNTNQP